MGQLCIALPACRECIILLSDSDWTRGLGGGYEGQNHFCTIVNCHPVATWQSFHGAHLHYIITLCLSSERRVSRGFQSISPQNWSRRRFNLLETSSRSEMPTWRNCEKQTDSLVPVKRIIRHMCWAMNSKKDKKLQGIPKPCPTVVSLAPHYSSLHRRETCKHYI